MYHWRTEGPTVDEIIVIFYSLAHFYKQKGQSLFHVIWQVKEAEHPPCDTEVASWHGDGSKISFCPPTLCFQQVNTEHAVVL